MTNKEIIVSREDIERKIEEFRKTGKEWSHFFNNFRGNLPFGWRTRGDGCDKYLWRDCEYSSLRKQSMTDTSFLKDIENTVKEVGLDLRKIEDFQKHSNTQELYEYVVPVYIRLREKGYNDNDLMS